MSYATRYANQQRRVASLSPAIVPGDRKTRARYLRKMRAVTRQPKEQSQQ